MRVFQVEGEWGMDHLRLSQRPQPQAGPGQVLVRMRASSLNYRDLVVPERGYGSYTGNLPLIPVSDGVGVVSEVGPGVHRVAPGDRVCPTFFQGWLGGEPDLDRLTQSLGGPIDGTMTDIMCLSEQGVVKVPEYLTDTEAASLPCAHAGSIQRAAHHHSATLHIAEQLNRTVDVLNGLRLNYTGIIDRS